MITKIFIFPKPWYSVAVFDNHDKQVPTLQGYYVEKCRLLHAVIKQCHPEIICDEPEILEDINKWTK